VRQAESKTFAWNRVLARQGLKRFGSAEPKNQAIFQVENHRHYDFLM
jgi:hypothetical protein